MSIARNGPEFKLGNHTIKFTPHNIVPTNSNEERTIHTTIEIYRKNILGRSKLIKRQNYCVSPAMTIQGFFKALTK